MRSDCNALVAVGLVVVFKLLHTPARVCETEHCLAKPNGKIHFAKPNVAYKVLQGPISNRVEHAELNVDQNSSRNHFLSFVDHRHMRKHAQLFRVIYENTLVPCELTLIVIIPDEKNH